MNNKQQFEIRRKVLQMIEDYDLENIMEIIFVSNYTEGDIGVSVNYYVNTLRKIFRNFKISPDMYIDHFRDELKKYANDILDHAPKYAEELWEVYDNIQQLTNKKKDGILDLIDIQIEKIIKKSTYHKFRGGKRTLRKRSHKKTKTIKKK